MPCSLCALPTNDAVGEAPEPAVAHLRVVVRQPRLDEPDVAPPQLGKVGVGTGERDDLAEQLRQGGAEAAELARDAEPAEARVPEQLHLRERQPAVGLAVRGLDGDLVEDVGEPLVELRVGGLGRHACTSLGRAVRSCWVYGSLGRSNTSSAVPDSTTLPSFITRIRSLMWWITPRSCEMNR
ncbi:hypothetical protein ACVW07_002157 [Cellulomonas sp. URHB0016]